MTRLILPALLALLVGCASDDAADAARSLTVDSVLRLPALHAEPDAEAGGRIIDADGREVLLRGVNVNALVEYWQIRPDMATTFPASETDADHMAEIGWNAVRLLLSWSRIEPAPARYDEAYLDEAARLVAVFAARGIYSIVDLHQDAWGPTLAGHPEAPCVLPQWPAFGWDGAPGWASLDGGAPRCTEGIRELSPAVRAAFTAFWNDAPGPEGVGVRARYVRMLEHVAMRFSGLDGVAGYDVMNEPNAIGDAEQAALASLYAEALVAIRAGEATAGVEPRLVLFEPSALWSTFGNGPPPDFARDRDVVYSPHVYTGGFTGGPITQSAFEVARQEAAIFGGAPVLSGEWGGGPERADNPADGYFITHQDFQDQFRLSATLWTWKEACGDPHKAADLRDGKLPSVWGEFEVDCTTNTVTGVRHNLVDQLTRGYLRAAPGQLDSLRYAHVSGALDAQGSLAPVQAQLVAFYPRSRHGQPRVEAQGLTDVTTLEASGDNAYVVARAVGGSWSLRIVAQ